MQREKSSRNGKEKRGTRGIQASDEMADGAVEYEVFDFGISYAARFPIMRDGDSNLT